MYYLQSRYYNPEWGRFVNADGIVGQTGELLSHNMFIYCLNNPINDMDPSGYWSLRSVVKATLAVTAIVAAVAVVAVITVSTAGVGTAVLAGGGSAYLTGFFASTAAVTTFVSNAAAIGATATIGYGMLEAQDQITYAKGNRAIPGVDAIPNLKRGNTEVIKKGRKKDNFKPRNNKRRPPERKPHTPGGPHQKHEQ